MPDNTNLQKSLELMEGMRDDEKEGARVATAIMNTLMSIDEEKYGGIVLHMDWKTRSWSFSCATWRSTSDDAFLNEKIKEITGLFNQLKNDPQS